MIEVTQEKNIPVSEARASVDYLIQLNSKRHNRYSPLFGTKIKKRCPILFSKAQD